MSLAKTLQSKHNQKIQFDSNKFQLLLNGLSKSLDSIDITVLFNKIVSGLSEEMTLDNLLEYAGEICATNITKHPNYGVLASKFELKAIYRKTSPDFLTAMKEAANTLIVSPKFLDFVTKHTETLNSAIMHEKDETLDYFAIKTIKNLFLLQSDNEIYERPQHMFMRVACQVHLDNIDLAIQTYHLISSKYFTHATPTIINSGLESNQLSSCFLLGMDDNVDGIVDVVEKMCNISRRSGGLGIHISNLRAKGTIGNSNYKSKGIIPTLKIFNEITRSISQNNNRKSACAIYLEPWHAEILTFVHLRKNIGPEEIRARDLFPALWIPDLFMKRIIENKDWSLFCPYKCPNLNNTFGKEFEDLYEKYENEGRAQDTIKARTLWKEIIKSQIETGTPYLVYKDKVNKTSNQANVGIIRSSNLCTEIVQYSDEKEVAVCNLASIGLPSFVEDIPFEDEKENNHSNKTTGISESQKFTEEVLNKIFKAKGAQFDKSVLIKGDEINEIFGNTNKIFNFEKLYAVVKIAVKNLNNVIDFNFYPVESSKVSNQTLRATGLGVQGLADVFAMLHIPFESEEARDLNRDIAETIYYAALEASCELAEKHGAYEKFEGSPASKGLLAFDLHGIKTQKYNFDKLKEKIKKVGLRNSLLIALMPTATTSILFNYNECFEPFTTNIYTRRTLSGDFQVINKYLLADLIKLGIWNENMKNLILLKKGSIQEIPEIPDNLKQIYKTVWEVKMRTIIDMAADRGAYVCQAQSLNLFLAQPTFEQMNAMHIYGWKKGLKTGMYYLRTMPIGSAIQFTVDRKVGKKKLKNENPNSTSSCSLSSDCLSCSS